MSNHPLPARGTDPPLLHEVVVSITHEKNICSKTLICRQLFAGHEVSSRPMKRKEKIHRMILIIISTGINKLVFKRMSICGKKKSIHFLAALPLFGCSSWANILVSLKQPERWDE